MIWPDDDITHTAPSVFDSAVRSQLGGENKWLKPESWTAFEWIGSHFCLSSCTDASSSRGSPRSELALMLKLAPCANNTNDLNVVFWSLTSADEGKHHLASVLQNTTRGRQICFQHNTELSLTFIYKGVLVMSDLWPHLFSTLPPTLSVGCHYQTPPPSCHWLLLSLQDSFEHKALQNLSCPQQERSCEPTQNCLEFSRTTTCAAWRPGCLVSWKAAEFFHIPQDWMDGWMDG